MSLYTTTPKTKAELVTRLLSSTFTGDLRDLSPDRRIQVFRPKPHQVVLKFVDNEFILAVHKPKPERARKAAKEAWEKRRKAKVAAPVAEPPEGRYTATEH